MNTHILILETSGRRGSVAVALGSEIREVRHLDEARRNARDLTPTVGELLRGQGWKPSDLDAVFVSRGPGSYTGLRVGIISAKTLAFATGCALIGIETFAAIARQTPPDCKHVDVVGDAQQDKVYVQPFIYLDGWQPAASLGIRRVSEWLADRDPEAWVSGPGLVKWREKLPATVQCLEPPAWEPGVASLLALGLARFTVGERDDAFTLEPLYLRESSAEEQWQKKA